MVSMPRTRPSGVGSSLAWPAGQGSQVSVARSLSLFTGQEHSPTLAAASGQPVMDKQVDGTALRPGIVHTSVGHGTQIDAILAPPPVP
mmetsp:Transcript_38703/g.56823  ORF Transcript_38703/g.56823 Transcript_38703/m.56823 type:complete len:88 (-) Transcript_38703:153-416(-)